MEEKWDEWFCENCSSRVNPKICEYWFNYYCPLCDTWIESAWPSRIKERNESRPLKPSDIQIRTI